VRPSGEKLKTLQITRSKMDKRLKVSLEFTVGESSLDFACLFDAPPPFSLIGQLLGFYACANVKPQDKSRPTFRCLLAEFNILAGHIGSDATSGLPHDNAKITSFASDREWQKSAPLPDAKI
jgi:hypothetical protein